MVQRIIKIFAGLFVGVFAFSQVLDGVSNAMALLTFKFAIYSTLIFIALYLFFYYYRKKRKIKWKSKDGQLLRVKKLHENILLPVFGMLILIWIGPIFNHFKKTSNSPSQLTSVVEIPKPIFDSTDERFKILVLPFYRLSEYQGKAYDIGKRICMRLDSLNQVDTLNLVTYYLNDSTNLANFTSKDADSLMKKNHADQIVYGFYTFKECEGTDSDNVCFSFRSGERLYFHDKIFQENDKWVDINGLKDIRDGAGQESIEYILYMVCSYSARIQGDFDKAIRKLQRIKNFENNSIVLQTIGDCYYAKNNLLGSKEYYEKTAKVDSNNFQAWNNLGYLQIKHDFEKSKKYLEKSLSINPSFVIALQNLGYLYFIHGDYINSKKNLLNAVANEPNNEFIWNNLGGVYKGLNDTINEMKCYEKGLEVNPFSFPILTSIGNYYIRRNDSRALQYFNKALERYPTDAIAMNNLGTYYLKTKNNLKAIDFLEKATGFRNNYIDAWINLANAYENVGRIEDMKKCADKALSLDPNSVGALLTYGNYLSTKKDFTGAIQYYKKCININPKDVDLWFNLGLNYKNLKKFATAKVCFEKAFSINPNDPQIWEMLGTINYAFLKNYNEAEKWYLKVLSLPKQKFEIIYYRLANINSIQKDRLTTLFYVKEAIKAYPSSKFLFKEGKNFQWLYKDSEFINLTK